MTMKPPDSGSGGTQEYGCNSAPSTEGSTTQQKDADGFWNVYQGSFGGGTKGRFLSPTYTYTRLNWKPIFETTVKTGSDISSVRTWCGLFSATPFGSATPAISYVAFRYDTGSDGTAFWRTVSDNGSGSPTVTTTSTAIAVSTKYSMRIEVVSTSSVEFYINDVLAATHSATLPAGATDLGFEMGVNPLAGTKQFWVNHAIIMQMR